MRLSEEQYFLPCLYREWCVGKKRCSDPKILCKELEQDYWSAKKLLETQSDKLW